jgi:hypothetical protein
MHAPLAGMVPPLKLTELPPAAAAIVPAPHEPVSPFGFCTKRFAGKVSVKATPVIGLADGLLIVNVNVEVCPVNTLEGLNDFEMLGGWANNAPDVAINMNKAATGAASQRRDRSCDDFKIMLPPLYSACTASLVRRVLTTASW